MRYEVAYREFDGSWMVWRFYFHPMIAMRWELIAIEDNRSAAIRAMRKAREAG